jgi:hypothetical protein
MFEIADELASHDPWNELHINGAGTEWTAAVHLSCPCGTAGDIFTATGTSPEGAAEAVRDLWRADNERKPHYFVWPQWGYDDRVR